VSIEDPWSVLGMTSKCPGRILEESSENPWGFNVVLRLLCLHVEAARLCLRYGPLLLCVHEPYLADYW